MIFCIGCANCNNESWLLYFNCLPDVLGLSVFCGPSTRCVGWSAVSDCDISWSFSFTFYKKKLNMPYLALVPLGLFEWNCA